MKEKTYKKIKIRTVLGCLAGNILIGIGVALFKLSTTGNDPSSAFVMAVSAKVGKTFAVCLLIFNLVCFTSQIIFGRKYIGPATFINWFCIGICTDTFLYLVPFLQSLSQSVMWRILFLGAGIIVLCLGAALYQVADLGIAPYDSISIVMSERLPIPYFWCRIITDSVCVILAVAFRGVVGAGTLICAVGLGPVISFFGSTVGGKLCGISDEDNIFIAGKANDNDIVK